MSLNIIFHQFCFIERGSAFKYEYFDGEISTVFWQEGCCARLEGGHLRGIGREIGYKNYNATIHATQRHKPSFIGNLHLWVWKRKINLRKSHWLSIIVKCPKTKTNHLIHTWVWKIEKIVLFRLLTSKTSTYIRFNLAEGKTSWTHVLETKVWRLIDDTGEPISLPILTGTYGWVMNSDLN